MAYSNDRKASVPYSSIAGLNTLPSEYDLAMQQEQDDFNMDKELDLFTNANFLDWDTGENVDQTFDPLSWQAADESTSSGGHAAEYVAGTHDLPTLSTVSSTEPFPAQSRPLHPQYNPALAPTNTQLSPTTPTTATSTGKEAPTLKRRHDSTVSSSNALDTPLDPTDSSALDVSAEEDKRRRNTAASARFRVKKKQREQAMEKTAKDMTDKVSALESRVGELEKENLLLKGLLTQRPEGFGASKESAGSRSGRKGGEVAR